MNRKERLITAAKQLQTLMAVYNISIEILQEEHDSFMILALVDQEDVDYEEPFELDGGYKNVIFNQHTKLNDE